MTKLRRFSLTAHQAPLCETIVDCPKPKGSEVLIRIERCGVCHSDLHMQDGFFALGEGNTLDVRAGRTPPYTLGHGIAGAVERAGPDATGAKPGAKVAVYPWIGCGVCTACKAGAAEVDRRRGVRGLRLRRFGKIAGVCNRYAGQGRQGRGHRPLGGNFPLPATMFVLKAKTVEGKLTGTLAEANELMALARAGRISSLPIKERPFAAAQQTLDDLRAGKVIGRVSLVT